MSRTTALSRNLRNAPTNAEFLVWQKLRHKQIEGHRFRRQHPLADFIVDFVCLEKRLVVEMDGGQHADSAADQFRDAWLAKEGYRVLRFWNFDVMEHLDGVMEAVRIALGERSTPPPRPSLLKGEGGFSARPSL
ncbi:MAG: endonuclease domain-containing protein [Betaproteobacteria bacterium]|nr:endonuclease domain-containing protein [Betaproteobacteria bacterium]